MRIHNHLPLLRDCLERWERPPALEAFAAEYYRPLAREHGVAFFDPGGARLHAALRHLDWEGYRQNALALDPAREEARLRRAIERVEALLGLPLQGDAVLFGAFCVMDGYARFDRGEHVVWLGVDESHGNGDYLDVLEAHELTHVARESRPEVWEGWGLSHRMSNAEFQEQHTIEHLMNEGFACAVSELAVPDQPPWSYCYQTRESLAAVLARAERVDEVVKGELELDQAGDWGRLYAPWRYGEDMPSFTHYVWAWQWARRLVREHAEGDPRRLVTRCSKDLVEDALAFRLPRELPP